MTEETKQITRKKRWRRAFFVTSLVVVALFPLGLWLWDRYVPVYPYGYTHVCSKNLALGLRMYANDHGGWMPHGGKTPEESLSFVCTNGDRYMVKQFLRGKHLPQSAVDDALNRNGVLSPDSCGWNYIEGLREGDGRSWRWLGTRRRVSIITGATLRNSNSR